MSKLQMCHVTIQPQNKTIEVLGGESLLEALRKENIRIVADCGGRGKCGKCKIKISHISQSPTQNELKALYPAELDNGVRLACEVKVNEDMVLELLSPDDLYTMQHVIEGVLISGELDSHLVKEYVTLTPADLNNQTDDLQNVLNYLEHPVQANLPLPVLQTLPELIRHTGHDVTVVVSGDEIIQIEPGDTRVYQYGIAFDLGTTTVVGVLVDLLSGQVLATHAMTNPQHVYGADVISRLNAVLNTPDGQGQLQQLIIGAFNHIIEQLSAKSGIKRQEIYEVTVAGNPIMNHIFLGVNPTYLGEAPFIPAYRKSPVYRAAELGLLLSPAVPIFVLPNISAYVGGDITAFLLAHDIPAQNETILCIDIGTNGEMVLLHAGEMVACSVAAGPALEGGQISCGMRATRGAIERVVFDDDAIYLKTIHGGRAKGICGSGLIDAIAEMIAWSVISETGVMQSKSDVANRILRERIIDGEQGREFIFVPGNETESGMPLALTQRDVRQVQLAKAAIQAGYNILISEYGLKITDIDRVLVAGAFGAYINKYNAQKIGLLPAVEPDKIEFVGNAASAGARKYLVSRAARAQALQIIDQVRYIELSSRIDFQDAFADGMFLSATI